MESSRAFCLCLLSLLWTVGSIEGQGSDLSSELSPSVSSTVRPVIQVKSTATTHSATVTVTSTEAAASTRSILAPTSLPTTSPVSCEDLDNPENGEVDDNNSTTEGSVAMYTCDEYYPLVGSDERTCLSNGTWAPEEPRCGCGQPLGIVNGNVNWSGDTAINETITLSCIPGYELSPGNVTTVKCTESGYWEPYPACVMEMLTPDSSSGLGSGDPLLPDSPTVIATPTLSPTVAATPSPDPTTPSTETPPEVFIQLSFNATREEFDSAIMPVLVEILGNITNTSVRIVVMVDTKMSAENTVFALVFFESTDTESGMDLTQMAFKALNSTSNAAWARIRQQYGVTVSLRMPSTDPPIPSVTSPVQPIPLALWHWLIIAVGNTLLILVVLILLYCCCRALVLGRRKKPAKGYMQHKLTYSEIINRQPPTTSLELGAYPGHPRKVSRIAFRPKGTLQQLSHPLTMEELEPLVENTAALYNEYASIPSNMVSMAEVPPGAEDKNRYRDVLPNPHTRVSLFLKFGVANSDYINANFVRGYRDTSKSYIATQGPLQWTAADFWRMVWEQRVSTIIMVTNFEERGTSKCARYWPDETINHSTMYEELELRLKRRLTASNKEYTTTTFHLAHKLKMVSREVTHFWFTGWPDHGVPLSAKSVVEFLLQAREHIREMPGPTVVHCSAGIGRTGVFIGADIGMQQLEEEGQVDLLKIVSTLRQDRGGMVQTRDQYVFLYKVLLEYAHYLSQARSNIYRGGRLRGQGLFNQLHPTIQEENSDTTALLT